MEIMEIKYLSVIIVEKEEWMIFIEGIILLEDIQYIHSLNLI